MTAIVDSLAPARAATGVGKSHASAGLAMERVADAAWEPTIADFDGVCQEQLLTFARLRWPKAEHEPILDRDLFEAVQAGLAASAVDRRLRRRASAALLCGRLYDDRGNHMSPSHSNKGGVRYRYYVSQALLQNRKADGGSIKLNFDDWFFRSTTMFGVGGRLGCPLPPPTSTIAS